MKNVQDRRARKTRESILTAFASLLAEKEYSKITVKEVAERADISRKTFYLHYSTLDDLLTEFLESRSRKSIEGLHSSGLNFDIFPFFMDPEKTDYEEIFSRAALKIKDQKKLLIRIINDPACLRALNQGEKNFLSDLQKQYRKRYRLDPEILDLLVAGMFFGFMEMYTEWAFAPSSSVSVEKFAEMTRIVFTDTQTSLRKLEAARQASS